MAAAFSVTALELVNRVHRRRRMEDVGSITAKEDLATLNAINSSIEDVMESNEWEFNQRHNGQLQMKARIEDMTVALTAGSKGNDTLSLSSTAYGLGNSINDELEFDDVIGRIELNGDTNYGQTALRIKSYAQVNAAELDVTVQGVLHQDISSTDANWYWSEYILPDTVASVTRVRYQEYPLTLENVDPTMEYDEIFPRPHIEYGAPEMISVGGFDIANWQPAFESEPKPGLRMAVWPVPDENYILHYSYTYRHPELVNDTDVLEGVPPNIVSRIVDLAATDMKIYFDKDEMAMKLRLHNMNDIRRANSKQGGSRASRKPIGNWDGSAARGKRFRDGFNGKLIGDY